jgi:hypothetical protein
MWKAQQDCCSFRNTGIFTGANPDLQDNQNQWGIYADGQRIALIEEAGPGRPQEVVDAQAHLVEVAPLLLSVLEDMLISHDNDYALPWRTVRFAIAQAKGQS